MPTPAAKRLSAEGSVGTDPLASRLVQYFNLYEESADEDRQEVADMAQASAEHAASLKPSSTPENQKGKSANEE